MIIIKICQVYMLCLSCVVQGWWYKSKKKKKSVDPMWDRCICIPSLTPRIVWNPANSSRRGVLTPPCKNPSSREQTIKNGWCQQSIGRNFYLAPNDRNGQVLAGPTGCTEDCSIFFLLFSLDVNFFLLFLLLLSPYTLLLFWYIIFFFILFPERKKPRAFYLSQGGAPKNFIA